MRVSVYCMYYSCIITVKIPTPLYYYYFNIIAKQLIRLEYRVMIIDERKFSKKKQFAIIIVYDSTGICNAVQ